MLELNVKYEEKDEVKALGASWNPTTKKWYVYNRKDYHKFIKWIQPFSGYTVITDTVYIVEAKQRCFKCGSETPVICFGVEKYYEIVEGEISYQNNPGFIQQISSIYSIPNSLKDYVDKKYKYRVRFSKTIEHSEYGNVCNSCGVPQGNFFLFSEPDSPLFLADPSTYPNCKLTRVKFKNDIIIDSDWCSTEFPKDEFSINDIEL